MVDGLTYAECDMRIAALRDDGRQLSKQTEQIPKLQIIFNPLELVLQAPPVAWSSDLFLEKSKYIKLLKTGVSVPRQCSGHPRTENAITRMVIRSLSLNSTSRQSRCCGAFKYSSTAGADCVIE